MTCIDRIIERHPWVAPLIIFAAAVAMMAAGGWE